MRKVLGGVIYWWGEWVYVARGGVMHEHPNSAWWGFYTGLTQMIPACFIIWAVCMSEIIFHWWP